MLAPTNEFKSEKSIYSKNRRDSISDEKKEKNIPAQTSSPRIRSKSRLIKYL